MPVTYSFTTETAVVKRTVPSARVRIDNIGDASAADGIYVVNCIPTEPLQAQLETALQQPYHLTDGISLELHYLTKASISIGPEPFNIRNGDTLELRVDNGYVQDVVVAGVTEGAATAEELAQTFAYQLRKVEVELEAAETDFIISTVSQGSTAALQIVGGTLVTKLGLSTSLQLGSELIENITFSASSFVDITNATATEVADVINAGSARGGAILSEDVGGASRFRIVTDDPEFYCIGEAAAPLGLLPWAEITSSNSEPFILHEGAKFVLKVDNGPEQIIVFHSNPVADINCTSAEYLVQVLNSKLKGAAASVTAGTKIQIRSNTESSASCLEITGGDTPAILGFAFETTYGAGKGLLERYIAEADDPIQFDVFNTKSGGITDVQVRVTTNREQRLVYRLSPSYLDPDWSVTTAENSSPGELQPDNIRYILQHTTPFVSEELVRVNVQARNSADDTVTVDYKFAVKDTRRPWIVSILPWSPKTLRVKFNESMDQITDGPQSSLYTRDVSGRVRYYAPITGEVPSPSKVEAPNTIFTSEDIGLFLGSAGARNAQNNFVAEIIGILQDTDGHYTQAEVDATLVNENPPASGGTEPPPRVVVSPYRIQRHTSLETSTPAYLPIVLDASPVASVDIAAGDDIERYVELTLNDDLTPSIPYLLEVVKICDPSGNLIGSTHEFNSWNLRNVLNRVWDLREELPQRNWDQDTSGDLLKLMNCLNEVAQILLNDVDSIADLFDPWSVKANALEHLLGHLGNPFAFSQSLAVSKRRQLAALLPYIYKYKGTTPSIEDSVLFFIGKVVTVQPWAAHSDTWIIGESELGVKSYLDPSNSFIRYAFTLEHEVVLSEDEKVMIDEIVHFARPAHTHFLGYEFTG